MQGGPFTTSLWYASAAPAPELPRLQDRIEADVCVIGGGYTGLSTAIHLARVGVRVAVLEAEEIGFGGSGRNAGHCTPTFHFYSLAHVRKMLGAPFAERLIARQTGAADLVDSLVRDYGIDCEWERSGFIEAAHAPSAMAHLQAKNAEYAGIGRDTRMLDRTEVATLTGSERYYGGWLHAEAGNLNPLGYARGLARAALREGARVFVGSRATSVAREGARWLTRTQGGGAVIADKVICGTGAYTDEFWPGLRRSFSKTWVFVAATQPLSDNLRGEVLPRRHSVHDGRGDLFVYKYDKDGRIVASMFPLGRRGVDMDYTRLVMTDKLRWLHPQLGEIEWQYVWSGDLDMQWRTIPRLFGLAPGVVAALGYSGRGVPTGTMMGTVLADWALGVRDDELALPVERLRRESTAMKLAPRAFLSWAHWHDNRTERRDGVPVSPH